MYISMKLEKLFGKWIDEKLLYHIRKGDEVMKKKNIIIVIIFCISLICNIFFVIDKFYIEEKTLEESSRNRQFSDNSDKDGESSQKTDKNQDDNITLNLDNNPIDKLFIENISGTTTDMRIYTNLYKELWENEMNSAYEKLMDKGHANIRDYIIESNNSYIEYAENRAEVVAAILASSAFEDEYKNDSNIHYGTFSLVIRNIELAKSYKTMTLEIFNYFDNIGIEPVYVFNKSNLSESDLEILELLD